MQVQALTRRLRELAEDVFERLRTYKSVFENFSEFWLQEPAHQFAQFLAAVGAGAAGA
jgi:hypothetical protein